MNALTRHAVVGIAICSWIAVSNHCAFAAVAPEIDKAQSECPFHSKPAKQKKTILAGAVLQSLARCRFCENKGLGAQ
jgi:hypothetical protein